jgi:hypothetical protein
MGGKNLRVKPGTVRGRHGWEKITDDRGWSGKKPKAPLLQEVGAGGEGIARGWGRRKGISLIIEGRPAAYPEAEEEEKYTGNAEYRIERPTGEGKRSADIEFPGACPGARV